MSFISVRCPALRALAHNFTDRRFLNSESGQGQVTRLLSILDYSALFVSTRDLYWCDGWRGSSDALEFGALYSQALIVWLIAYKKNFP